MKVRWMEWMTLAGRNLRAALRVVDELRSGWLGLGSFCCGSAGWRAGPGMGHVVREAGTRSRGDADLAGKCGHHTGAGARARAEEEEQLMRVQDQKQGAHRPEREQHRRAGVGSFKTSRKGLREESESFGRGCFKG